jgi:hypothetical protein
MSHPNANATLFYPARLFHPGPPVEKVQLFHVHDKEADQNGYIIAAWILGVGILIFVVSRVWK